MISNQILQNTIDGLKNITRTDLCVIDVEGKISANFLTSSKELEEGLRNNLYILRQKFEEQGIKYGSIEYTSMEKDNTQIDIQEVIKTIQAAESNSTLEERNNNEKTIH